ncbi:MAG: hypothetical protein HZC28_13535 [Spirochaetes bacterium]|nr:hypothetical protein [Spirochaetota bacterium]
MKKCECCGDTKARLFNIRDYTRKFTYVCGSCALMIIGQSLDNPKNRGLAVKNNTLHGASHGH